MGSQYLIEVEEKKLLKKLGFQSIRKLSKLNEAV
jgi:hypothetical protein